MSKAKIHVDVDADLKKKFKIIAAKKGVSVRKIITNLVADYVKNNKS